MELHAQGEVAAKHASERIAGEIRAELARQKRTASDMAAVIGIAPHTAGRRLNGERPFNIVELAAVCRWLGVDMAGVVAKSLRDEAVAS
ncbi:hypothetical protein [Microbacterium sp. PA5]|uniref:hypothetical protein n=1 Tax=Microbacterium sp. PA5 TaxID=3416654 RepID=UPI003CEF20DC